MAVKLHSMANHTTYCIMPDIDMGMLSREELARLSMLCEKYDVPALKVTSAQRVAVLGLDPEKLEAFKLECGIADGPPHKLGKLNYVQACPGSRWCKYGVGDSLRMGEALQKIQLDGSLPAKVKVGVSGCRICCCESWVRDVGLIAQKSGGWNVIFGGNGAGRPRIGDLVAENVPDHKVVALVKKLLIFYQENAKFKTRSARFMERVGIDRLKQGLGLP